MQSYVAANNIVIKGEKDVIHEDTLDGMVVKNERKTDDMVVENGAENLANQWERKHKIDNDENDGAGGSRLNDGVSGSKIQHLEIDYESIWTKLKGIVDELITRTDAYKQWETEFYDILFVISTDPDKITYFDIDYGTKKVETAIKAASKLLYPNGSIDLGLVDYFWKKRSELIDTLNISTVTEKSISSDWSTIAAIVNFLHSDYTFNMPAFYRNSDELKAQKFELSVIMAVDPNSFRQKITSLDIGQSKAEICISVCTHILERVLKQDDSAFATFRHRRNEKIKGYGKRFLKKINSDYDQVFDRVRCIACKYYKHGSDIQIDAFTILMMLEPKMMYSKFLLFTESSVSDESLTNLEDELKICVKQNTYVDEKPEAKTYAYLHNTMNRVVIIAHVHLTKTKAKHLHKHLRDKLLINENDPEISIYDYYNRHIICSNLTTLEWLKVTLDEFSTNVFIDTWTQLADNEFREVIMLSQVRFTKSFDVYQEKFKANHPNLRTERWTCLGSVNDWKMAIRVDVRSILYLEQNYRRLDVDGLVFKFKILYVQ